MLPYFRKSEHYVPGVGKPNDHGYEGPMNIKGGAYRKYPLAEATRQAFSSIGAKEVPDANNGYPHGYAPLVEK